MSFQAGDMRHGQYQIQRGGFGNAYHARDVRVRAEAKATMHLSHEHIARTHTLFLEDGNYCIVMEYLAGGSLEFCLRPFCFLKKGGDHLHESTGRS